MCGGSYVEEQERAAGQGLSPRVRGKQPPGFLRHQPPGSIPACAGEALAAYGATAQLGVYPRVCGGSS